MLGQFLRANAAAIPPTTTPTTVAAIPIPITPSAFFRGKKIQCQWFQKLRSKDKWRQGWYISIATFLNSVFNCFLKGLGLPPIRCNLQKTHSCNIMQYCKHNYEKSGLHCPNHVVMYVLNKKICIMEIR